MRLSPDVYRNSSIQAVGEAQDESWHAPPRARHYWPLQFAHRWCRWCNPVPGSVRSSSWLASLPGRPGRRPAGLLIILRSLA
ncbi:MAG: hypothetical protein IPO34_21580 [Dehalococcoidia bacterium]|nr:hypothetical protein [Dehalococcoidia bacterium]